MSESVDAVLCAGSQSWRPEPSDITKCSEKASRGLNDGRGKRQLVVFEERNTARNGKAPVITSLGGEAEGLFLRGVMVGRTLLNQHTQSSQEGNCVGKCERVDVVIDVESQEENVGEAGEVTGEFAPRLRSLPERSSVGLSEGQPEEKRELLLRRQDLFSKGSMDLGQTSIVAHKIETGDAEPSLPLAKREEAVRAIDEMKSQGVIEPASGEWGSMIVLVKKDGSMRFCVEYRCLNRVTKKDSYPLPRIDDILDALTGSQWFCALDLYSGYWHPRRKKGVSPKLMSDL
ncbi:uncharacterized protein LOC115921611 [Strongylocentrotus purpuratus]|uniref:Reverse transcriptase domain-containing protein n=1 Tax=Strongylocentrotus purpuratus TaxID=7668 RepID=A0A7M7NDL8_STRPU|nr:uncharacterized protein LOC115921611 [Strongylocentrotus purpuratus]